MNIYIKIFLGILAVAAVATICFLLVGAISTKVVMDKTEYRVGDPAEVTIKNDTERQVCFSSCYPYLVEKQAGDKWLKYSYGVCDKAQVAVNCIQAGKLKKFLLTLDEVGSGLHRLDIQICSGCDAGQNFEANLTVASNSFTVQGVNK